MPLDDAGVSPLESPALGSSLTGLIRSCGDTLRPAEPERVAGRETIALAFSGGGFRATLTALGVIRFMADCGRLSDVRYVSSVSGGSIANGRLASQWPQLRSDGFSSAAVDRLVIDPIVSRVSARSMKFAILRGAWRAVGPQTRTDVLARTLDRWFFGGTRFEQLDPQCRFIINAANLRTGTRFGFERDVLGDYVTGLAPTAGTGVTLSRAVAASAAVPGVFAPVAVTGPRFPCGAALGDPMLVDGGAYDNTGLEPLDGDRHRDVFIVAVNAGGIFVTGNWGRVPLARDLARSSSLLYRQSTTLRTRWMIDRFRAWEDATAHGQEPPNHARPGVLFGLATTIDEDDDVRRWRDRFPEHRTWDRRDLAFVPTVFDKLDRRLCRLLVYRGWWLTGATLARYHKTFTKMDRVAPPPLGAAGSTRPRP